jgi:hypothetical protein
MSLILYCYITSATFFWSRIVPYILLLQEFCYPFLLELCDMDSRSKEWGTGEKVRRKVGIEGYEVIFIYNLWLVCTLETIKTFQHLLDNSFTVTCHKIHSWKLLTFMPFSISTVMPPSSPTNVRTFPSPEKENSVPFSSHSPFSLAPVSGNHRSTVCLYGFHYWEHFS